MAGGNTEAGSLLYWSSCEMVDPQSGGIAVEKRSDLHLSGILVVSTRN